MSRTNRLAAAAATALLFRFPLPAEDCPAIDPPVAFLEHFCPAVDPPGRVGLRVFLDRKTGRIRAPTPEEARALFEAGGGAVEDLEPLEIVLHPDGMRSVELKGAFSFQVVLSRNPDGSFTTRCIPSAGTAAEEK